MRRVPSQQDLVAESDAASALEDAGIGALPFRTVQLRPSLTLTVSFVIRPSPVSHNQHSLQSYCFCYCCCRDCLQFCYAHAHTSALTRNPPQPAPYRSDLQRVRLTPRAARNRESHLLLPRSHHSILPRSSPQSLVLFTPLRCMRVYLQSRRHRES
jgi:hypothetical protein